MLITDPLLRPYSGAKLRLQVEFLDRINRQQRRRCASDPSLVERGVIEERIVVVGAVHGVVVRPIPVAVDRELPKPALDRGHARRLHRCSGNQRHQFAEVPPVQRKICHQPLVHHFSQHIARRFHQGRVFADRHVLPMLLNFEHAEVGRSVQAHAHHHILRNRRESWRVHGHGIVSRRQFSQHITYPLRWSRRHASGRCQYSSKRFWRPPTGSRSDR